MQSPGMHPAGPPVKDRLAQPRSIFAPGSRIRMNFVPLFLNLFLPWGVFTICNGLTSFSLMNERPTLVFVLLGLVFAFWLASCYLAYWARVHLPEPTWFTYAAVAIGIAFISGTYSGLSHFGSSGASYNKVADLKVASQVDVNIATGLDVLDAGVVFFADGTHLDGMRSWHFKQRHLYCVAPIVSNKSRTFDFWAVGRDCCSVDSSDFRCGAWGASNAHTGIRVLDEDVPFYRLAVQQAETLYGIVATHPTFFRWSQDPVAEMESQQHESFRKYQAQTMEAFVVCLLGLGLMAFRFAWLGRSSSAYHAGLFSNNGAQHGYAAI